MTIVRRVGHTDTFFTNGIPSIFGDLKNYKLSTSQSEGNKSYYDMSGDKFLLIFNHRKYKNFGCRRGTKKDVKALIKVFSKMNYTILRGDDVPYEDIMEFMEIFCNENHDKTACVCIAILTHGGKDGMLYAADVPYYLSEITTKLENGDEGLLGKPKLFFIQACRGSNCDAGRRVNTDGQLDVIGPLVLPTTADFLFFRSTVEGYVSYRDKYIGSYFIQALCKALKENPERDIHYVATLTNTNIAFMVISLGDDEYASGLMKQMPEVQQTLTKLFNFV